MRPPSSKAPLPGLDLRARPLLTLLALTGLAGCGFQRYEERPLDPAAALERFSLRSLDDPRLADFARLNLGPRDFPPPRWELESLTQVAFFYRHELDAARAEYDAARAEVESASARPNPTLALDPEVVPGATHPWILGFNLDLTFETAGKRGLRTQAATELEHRAELDLYALAWSLRAEVREALDGLRAARAETRALDRTRATRQARYELVRARLESGDSSRLALAPAERELLDLELELQAARGREERAPAALARALGVPLQALGALELEPDPELPELPSALEARDMGLQNRLDLRRSLGEYALSEADLALEIARQYPDVHLAPGTSWDQGDHKYALGFAVELPLFHRNEGPIAAAEARRSAAEARFLARQEQAIGAIEEARLRYAAALRELEAAERAWQAAEQQSARVTRSLEAGALARADQLEARLTRDQTEQARIAAEARARLALGALEDELQRPLVGGLEPARLLSPPERSEERAAAGTR